MASARYVPRDTIDGVEDLDEYGSWSQDADLGPVWVPAVTIVGWAPYRFGHWAWIAPWGWTWIDDAPWGFAPFHYGRWAFRFNHWAWVPGPSVFHPVYAPAMVVFVGGGGMLPGRAPGGSIGWFPLGPHEPYIPPYTSDRSHLHNVDVEHYTWVNHSVPGAVTIMGRDDFMRGHAAGPSAFALRQDEVVRVPVLGAPPPFVPHQGFAPGPIASRGPVAQPPGMGELTDSRGTDGSASPGRAGRTTTGPPGSPRGNAACPDDPFTGQGPDSWIPTARYRLIGSFVPGSAPAGHRTHSMGHRGMAGRSTGRRGRSMAGRSMARRGRAILSRRLARPRAPSIGNSPGAGTPRPVAQAAGDRAARRMTRC